MATGTGTNVSLCCGVALDLCGENTYTTLSHLTLVIGQYLIRSDIGVSIENDRSHTIGYWIKIKHKLL